MVEWVRQDVGATVEPLTADGWKELLVNAGLQDIVMILENVDVKIESRGILKRYGIGGMLSIVTRAFQLYLRNPNYRQFVKEVNQGGLVPEDFNAYFGYGIFVGRKDS